MNIFSTAIAGFFAVLAVAFLLFLVVAIVRNLRTGLRYRQGIARQLSFLRLDRMLGIHGIDQASYLHSQPIRDIRDQMKRCSDCASTRECDRLLDEGVGDQADFCDNDEKLRQVKKQVEHL